jgi:hypothetical protein
VLLEPARLPRRRAKAQNYGGRLTMSFAEGEVVPVDIFKE